MIEAIGRSSPPDLADAPLTGALAMKGAAYSGELMWVGRAVNRWTQKGWSPAELRNPERVAEFIEIAASSSVEEPCPLCWVTEPRGINDGGYNPAKSAFWRTAKATLLRPDETDALWSSRLVWSNLYKLAPWKGGNPGSRLAAIQFPFCRDLLMQEIDLFRPRRIVFATGLNWVDRFLDHTRFVRSDLRPFGQNVLGLGDLVLKDEKVGKFVIAVHPARKPERPWI